MSWLLHATLRLPRYYICLYLYPSCWPTPSPFCVFFAFGSSVLRGFGGKFGTFAFVYLSPILPLATGVCRLFLPHFLSFVCYANDPTILYYRFPWLPVYCTVVKFPFNVVSLSKGQLGCCCAFDDEMRTGFGCDYATRRFLWKLG